MKFKKNFNFSRQNTTGRVKNRIPFASQAVNCSSTRTHAGLANAP